MVGSSEFPPKTSIRIIIQLISWLMVQILFLKPDTEKIKLRNISRGESKMNVNLNNAEWSYILGLLEQKVINGTYDEWGEMIIPRIARKIDAETRNINNVVDEFCCTIMNEMDPDFELEEAI